MICGCFSVPGFPPKGLIVSLVTPLDTEGEIDGSSLGRLIHRALPYCSGLLIGEGLVGEGFSLSSRKLLDLFSLAIKVVSGRKPLFLCVTAGTQEETLQNAAAVEKNFSAQPEKEPPFLVDVPLWYHSNRRLPQFYQEWARYTSLPILLYNHPRLICQMNRSLKRSNVRTAVLQRLSENEKIVGLIQAGDFKRTLDYQRAVGGRRNFLFYDGDEKSFLNQPSSSGVVSWGANLLLAEWSEIVSASLSLSEDPARTHSLLQQSQKLLELNQALGTHPAKQLKFALHHLGLITQAKVLNETTESDPKSDLAIRNFMRENFSLQFPA